MQDRPSIVQYYSKNKKSHCGYCSSDDGSYTYGLHAYTLRVQDYQDMIDRGWRRCGQYCYKLIMDISCCPSYTIRCAAKDVKLSKTQKKIVKRFNNFLIDGDITKVKVHKSTEIVQPMEVHQLNESCKVAEREALNIKQSSVEGTAENKYLPEENIQKQEEKIDKPIEPVKTKVSNNKELRNKNKCMKAKYLRIERKKQKLQNLGLKEDEIAKKLVEKKKYPVIKTIEDYLNDPLPENQVHNLKISLVRSYPRSEEFDNTFAVTFDLLKRYQMIIHNFAPEKLTQSWFERFLVISPLQIHLVLVKSPEFEKTFRESSSLFAKYQKVIHHELDEDCDVSTFNDFLVNSPLEASKGYGSYHQQYWLDNKLIAVGVIDILPKCVSSVYFFYDPDYAHLSLGTYGALREIEFTRKLSSRFPDLVYYYMGFYIHSCVKMKYKAAFKPSFLLCPELYTWHPIKECIPKLEKYKYSRFNEDPSATDINSKISDSEVLILYKNTVITLGYYLKQKKNDPKEREEIYEYARLVGKTCGRNMLLLRM